MFKRWFPRENKIFKDKKQVVSNNQLSFIYTFFCFIVTVNEVTTSNLFGILPRSKEQITYSKYENLFRRNWMILGKSDYLYIDALNFNVNAY